MLQITRIILWCIIAIIFSATGASAQSVFKNTTGKKKLLILHSYHSGFGWTDQTQLGIQRALRASAYENSSDLYVEYLDAKRADRAFVDSLAASFLAAKYGSKKLDGIIVSDNVGLEFVLDILKKQSPSQLANEALDWKEVPIVFCGINHFNPEMLRGEKHIYGVKESIDVQGTVEMALKLFPSTNRFFLVNDETPTGLANHKEVEAFLKDPKGWQALRQKNPNLKFEFSGSPSLNQLQETLAGLPRKTVVLLMTFHQDGLGVHYSMDRYLTTVKRNSSVPVFGFWSHYMNQGIIGGKNVNGFAQGSHALELMLSLWEGDVLNDDQRYISSPNVSELDVSVLEEFIPLADIPDSIVSGMVLLNNGTKENTASQEKIPNSLLVVGALLILTMGIVLVILWRKRNQHLREEFKLRSVFDSVNEVGIIADTDSGELVSWNERAKGVYRLKKGESYTLQHIFGLDPRFEESGLTEYLNKAGHQRGFEFEWMCGTHEGGSFHGKVFLSTIKEDPAGDKEYNLFLISDVTSEVNAVQALKLNEEKYRKLFEQMPQGIVYYDPRGSIRLANPAALQILNYDLRHFQEIGGEDVRSWQCVYEDGTEFPTENHPSEIARKEGRVVRNVIMGLKKAGGEVTWLKIWAIPCFASSEDGNVLEGVYSIFEDISEWKGQEDSLRKSQRMESIGQLAGGIAHDFNNMLGGILGAADLLQSELQDEDLRSYPELIIDTCDRAAELTQKLLTFSRRAMVVLKEIDLHEVIHSASEALEKELPENIQIYLSFDSPQSKVMGDAQMLRSVFLNLGHNAADAMPDGGILRIVTEMKTIEDGEFIVASVSDTGVGMNELTLERVFDPFYTTKDFGKSNGLGLSSAFGIAQEHHGALTAESVEGEGSTFQFRLPLFSPVKRVRDKSNLTKGTVLLVDDETSILETMGNMLNSLDYDYISAKDGVEAVRLFKANQAKISFVLMDIIMPNMGGREAALRIREEQSDIPIIFCSGYDHESSQTYIRDLTVDGFLKKPFRVKELEELISIIS